MAQINIKPDVRLDEIENYYSDLYVYTAEDSVIDLCLPTELVNYYVGLVPAIYQFVITWIRYKNSGKLLLDISNPDSADFKQIYENELLFPVVSLVWNKNGVYNLDGTINLRNFLRPLNSEIFDKMKGVKVLKGNKLLLTNFDHLPLDRGILPCFEINHEFIKDESILYNNLTFGILGVLTFSQDIAQKYFEISKPLSGIIYELMKNTFEWAKEDENGAPLDPNMRGLLIKFYKKTRDKLITEFKNHKGLKDYFSHEELNENVKNELYFLEVDVFDSGIGFVDRYNSLNAKSDLTDAEIVKKCMIVHSTSAKGLERDDKGIGLDRILTILDKKGFLRIRTGNVCLYRDLISFPHKKIENKDIGSMELFDWLKNSNTTYTEFKKAEGSVLTIIYPLSIKD